MRACAPFLLAWNRHLPCLPWPSTGIPLRVHNTTFRATAAGCAALLTASSALRTLSHSLESLVSFSWLPCHKKNISVPLSTHLVFPLPSHYSISLISPATLYRPPCLSCDLLLRIASFAVSALPSYSTRSLFSSALPVASFLLLPTGTAFPTARGVPRCRCRFHYSTRLITLYHGLTILLFKVTLVISPSSCILGRFDLCSVRVSQFFASPKLRYIICDILGQIYSLSKVPTHLDT